MKKTKTILPPIEYPMYINSNGVFRFGADSPDIAERVIKKHKENKKMSTILCVANLIAKTPCKIGISNYAISTADGNHPLSGTQRLRELAKRFYASDCWERGFTYAYEYSHNRYYPTAAFKRFCKRFLKERS
jgi:hypothetical protein